jgi:hypothetical protein
MNNNDYESINKDIHLATQKIVNDIFMCRKEAILKELKTKGIQVNDTKKSRQKK